MTPPNAINTSFARRRMTSFSPRSTTASSFSSSPSSLVGGESRKMGVGGVGRDEFLLRVCVDRFKLLSTHEINEALLVMGTKVVGRTLELVSGNLGPPKMLRSLSAFSRNTEGESVLESSFLDDEDEEEEGDRESEGSSRPGSPYSDSDSSPNRDSRVSRGDSDMSAQAFIGRQLGKAEGRDDGR